MVASSDQSRPGDRLIGKVLVRIPVPTSRLWTLFEDAGDGWVYAHVPELPEVQTQGDSLEDARRMVREAIALVLEERQSRGELIPETGWALV